MTGDAESGPVGTRNGECQTICHSGGKLGSDELANLRLGIVVILEAHRTVGKLLLEG